MTGKIGMVAASEDGDRIYCIYKQQGDTLLKGFYDFDRHTFIITEFYTKKLQPEQTPRDVILAFKELLNVDFDWELKNEESIIKNIEEGLLKGRRKKRNGQKNTHAD